MGWAARRRFIILFILGAIVVAFLAVMSIAAFYETPTCSDGVRNQEEAGIDCGGPCAYLCTEQQKSPVVLFTKVIQNSDGRTDIVAKIENKNLEAAAKNVPYRLALYGEGNLFLQEITGTLDMPPRTTVPIFLPGVQTGKQKVLDAFLDVEASAPRWFTFASQSLALPTVTNTKQVGSVDAPRIEAILTNEHTSAFLNMQVIVLVHDEGGSVIAASRTVVPTIPAQGQATATFTWNSAFPGVPVSIEVVPVILLP